MKRAIWIVRVTQTIWVLGIVYVPWAVRVIWIEWTLRVKSVEWIHFPIVIRRRHFRRIESLQVYFLVGGLYVCQYMAHFIGATQNPASAITVLAVAFEYQQIPLKPLPSTCKAFSLFQWLIAGLTNWNVSQNLLGHITSPGQILNANLSINYYSEEIVKFNICPWKR